MKTGLYVMGATKRKRKDEREKSISALEFRKDDKSNAVIAGNKEKFMAGILTNNNKDKIDFLFGAESGRRLNDGKSYSRNFGEGYRVASTNSKSATLTAKSKGGVGGYTGAYLDIMKLLESGELVIRKLTPTECERLQTMPDCYTQTGDFDGEIKPISNTQRYKALGNAWTVDVVAHIFSYINGDTIPKLVMNELFT